MLVMMPPVSEIKVDARLAPVVVPKEAVPPLVAILPVVAIPMTTTVHFLNARIRTRCDDLQIARDAGHGCGLGGHEHEARCKDAHRRDKPSSYHSLLLHCHFAVPAVA
jgi:hypothetical protein